LFFDLSESGSSKNKQLSKTKQQSRPVDMYSPAVDAVNLHIGVGFGVARFDN
jgi:hypothetical protein